ncbi:MAG: ABC transporter substrate-binding protein [Oligoflexia bacterium]|nr:ABC transporter substrate-binding protein [Oligoflexia bacterium]
MDIRYPLRLLSLIFMLCACTAEGQDLVRLGAIASLTGPAGEEGRNWLEGAELAVAELKTQGRAVELYVEDDSTVPSKLAGAFRKLVAANKVQAIIGGTWDFLGETAYPLARQMRIPFVTPTNPDEIIPEAERNNPYIFAAGLSLAAEKEALKAVLVAERVRSLTIYYPRMSWGEFHAAMMREVAKELKLTASEVPFPIESFPANVQADALNIVKLRSDAVFASIDYNGLDLLTRNFARLHYGPKLFTTQHLEDAFNLSREPERFKAAFGVYPAINSASFEQAFEKQYGRHPKVYAAEGYDAVKFLYQAIAAKVNFGKPPADFRYEGAAGEYKFPEVGGRSRAIVQTAAKIMTTRKGRFEPY